MLIPEKDNEWIKSNTLINKKEVPIIKKKELFMYFREFQPIKKTPPEITILRTSASE